jgi:hypothetical protein
LKKQDNVSQSGGNEAGDNNIFFFEQGFGGKAEMVQKYRSHK